MSQIDVESELAGLSLFADLTPAQLEKAGQAFEEQWFQPGERAQRQGFAGSGFHVIVSGEAEWRVDGQKTCRHASNSSSRPEGSTRIRCCGPTTPVAGSLRRSS